MKKIYFSLFLFVSIAQAQISLVKDIYPGVSTAVGTPAFSSLPTKLFSVAANLMYFRATDGTNGTELWKTDGTTAGTVLVRDIATGTINSNVDNFINFAGSTFFSATTGTAVNGTELWRTDGTAAGTIMVKDIFVGTGSSNPQNFTIINPTTMLFNASDGIGGNELWKTDGLLSVSSTVNVVDYPGTTNSVTWIENLNGTGILGQIVSTTGRELYKSDGTTANSGLVAELSAGTASGVGTAYFKFGNQIYFQGNSGTTGLELWKTDGTTAGTVLVKDINTTANTGSLPKRFAALGNFVYFNAAGDNGIELWRTDGTNAGTTIVADINPGTGGSNPDLITEINGSIYYFAADDGTNFDLYKFDGTTNTKLYDFNALGSTITNVFVKIGNKIFFPVDSNADSKRELWQTDGTAAGTVSVANTTNGYLNPLNVSNLTAMEGTNLLLFSGELADGNELYKLDATPLSNQVNTLNAVTVYPNPTNGTLNIAGLTTQNAKFTISDILGKVISFGNINNQTIDFSADNGVYFLKISAENGDSSVKKIIKQ
jgi:ELWxxDGT repeat protein